MTLSEISNARLINQKISIPEFNSALEVVRWMGAIQAQDYQMAKWAIGTRLSDPSDQKIESSFDKGDIIRVHVLRPTWHLIPAEDIFWMLRLTAPKIKSLSKSRHKELGLTEPVIRKTNSIIEKALSNGSELTREELSREFHKAKIKTDGNRLSHIMFCAELDGIVCSGAIKGNRQTYTLLSERVPRYKHLSKEESLAELAKRYLLSRSPATLQDFVWWSNLAVSEARQGMDSIKSDFSIETIGSVKYWFPNSFTPIALKKPSVHLLPAYDEYLISYKDRSSSLSIINNKKTVSDNGIFRPPIVVNGQVAGLWKRIIQKNKVIISTEFFQPINKSTGKLIHERAKMFGKFLNKEIEIIINQQ